MIIDGELIFRSSDGREFKALVFGYQHARRVVDAWSHDDCPETYQAASGEMLPCVKEAGHEGRCGHRR